MATTLPDQATAVAGAAEALAHAMQEADPWQRWVGARERCERDPGLTRAQERLAELTKRLRSAHVTGRGLFGPDIAELDRLRREVHDSPLVREREQAEAALVEFLQDTNGRLSEALGLDFAKSAAPRGGGCCG